MRKRIKYTLYSMLLLIAVSCGVDALEILDEPSSVTANQVFTVKLQPTLNYSVWGGDVSGYKNMIVAVLVPKKWNATIGDNMTLSYSSDIGSGPMVRMGASEKPNDSELSYPAFFKQWYGAGNNLFDDHEWVVFKTDKQYELQNGQTVKPIVTINIRAGADNILTKLGYVVALSGEGAEPGSQTTKFLMSDNCFEVKDGTGANIDFCNPPLASVTPLTAAENDFITFTFDNDLRDTPLSSAANLYLTLIAHLSDGTTLELSGANGSANQNKMRLSPLPSKKYKLAVHPRGIFGLTGNQSILKIEYFITNGTEKIGSTDTEGFIYELANCN